MIFVKENHGQARSCTVTLGVCDGSSVSPIYITVNQNKSEGVKIESPNVYLLSASKTGLTFAWDEVEGAESYDVYFDLTSNLDDGKLPTRVMDSYTGTEITFTSLTSYLTTSNDDRVSISGNEVLSYNPEDSWSHQTVKDNDMVEHNTLVYGLPNGSYFTLTAQTTNLSPITEYTIGIVAHSYKGTFIGETLEGRFTIYTTPPGLDGEPTEPGEINSDY